MRIVVLLLGLVAGLFALFAGDLLDHDYFTPYLAIWPDGENWRAGAIAVWFGLPAAAILAGLFALFAPGSAALLLLIAAIGWGGMGLLIPELNQPVLAIAPGAALLAALLAFIAGELQVRRERAMRRRLRAGRFDEEAGFDLDEFEDEAEEPPPPPRGRAAAREIAAREAALNIEPELLAREPVMPTPAATVSERRTDEPFAAARPSALASLAGSDVRAPAGETPRKEGWTLFPARGGRQEREPEIARAAPPRPFEDVEDVETYDEPIEEPPPPTPEPAPVRRGIGAATAWLLALNLIVVAALAGLVGYLLAGAAPAPSQPLVGAVTASPAAAPGETFADPFAYCAAVVTVDAPDQRYVGAAVPEAIANSLSVATESDPARVRWRCFDGRVLACQGFAWPLCDKVPTTAELTGFCAKNPNVPRLLAPAGTWSCVAGKPQLPAGISWGRDERGFGPAGWRIVPRS